MLANRQKITVIGSANMDLVVRTERIPAPGETVLGGEFFSLPGGKGANQAVAAARLGGDVTFVGCVGRDAFGDSLASGLAADKIDISHLARLMSIASGIALIGVDAAGQNSIIVAPGANGKLTVEHVNNASGAIRNSAVLLAQREVPADCIGRGMHIAVEAGAITILNPAPFHPGEQLPAELLKRVSVLVPNEHEALAMLGLDPHRTHNPLEIATRLIQLGPSTVIVTFGAKGYVIADAKEAGHFETTPVEAIDTTAAGDCFCGALAVGLAEGKGIEAAARFAAAAAAISVTRMGAQTSMPWRGEVLSFPIT